MRRKTQFTLSCQNPEIRERLRQEYLVSEWAREFGAKYGVSSSVVVHCLGKGKPRGYRYRPNMVASSMPSAGRNKVTYLAHIDFTPADSFRIPRETYFSLLADHSVTEIILGRWVEGIWKPAVVV